MNELPEGLRRLQLRAEVRDVALLAAWLEKLFAELHAAARDRFRIELALTEAVMNIVTHASGPGVAQGILLEVTIATRTLRARITDEGAPFDPLTAETRPLPATLAEAEPGGAGLVLIRKYSDDATYARVDRQNVLTLGFNLEYLAGKAEATDLALCQAHPLLGGLPLPALQQVIELCEQRGLAAGEVLLSPGSQNRTLYFLLRGSLEVHMSGDVHERNLKVKPGEIIGEMSIIESLPVYARVTAEDNVTVLAMPAAVFWERYCSNSALIPPLLQSMIRRMRRTNLVLQQELERRIRYEMLQRELESAARIQTGILPVHHPLLESPLVDAHHYFKQAREVGGDFYDAITLSRHRLAVAIGDVSGKGMPAALFMMRTVSLLRMILLRHRDPARILPELNRQLCEANDECMFVTLAVLILDTDTGVLTYLNAGHNPVLVAKAGQPFEVWEAPPGVLLGVNPNAVFLLKERILARDDTVVLYTDGVTEAENSAQALFGLDRALAALSSSPHRQSSAGMVGDLESAVSAFVQQAPQSDDVTVLALTYKGALLPDGTHWNGRVTRQPFSGRASHHPGR